MAHGDHRGEQIRNMTDLAEILDDLKAETTKPLHKVALAHCISRLRNSSAQLASTKRPTAPATPPAAPVLTITEVDGPTPPIRAHAHDAAVKAAATRKANKQKSAGIAEKIGADTKAPKPLIEPAVTE